MATSSSRAPWGRRLAWLAAGLVVVVAIAWAALAILLPPERVRTLVQQQLSATLERPVRFEAASVSLFPPVRLGVRGLALAEPGGFERGAAVQVRELALDLNVLALLSRKIEVRRLHLDRPTLHLVLRPDGTTNLDGIGKPATEQPQSKPMDLSIRGLSIEGGRLLVDDLETGKRTYLEVESRLGFSTEQEGTRIATDGTTVLSGLRRGPFTAVRVEDLGHGLADLRWQIEHRGKFDSRQKRLALERLALQLGATEIALSGVLDEPGPRARVNLTARGTRVDLAEVLRFVAEADAKAVHGIRGAGQLDFDLAVRGALGGATLPAVTGTVALSKASFRYPGAPAGVDALSFTARLAPDSLGIGDLRSTIEGQPVTGQLVVTRFADPRVRFVVKGDVDLAAVAPLVAPKDTKLGGRAAVNVTGEGRAKDPGSFALAGGARLEDVSVETPTQPKKLEAIQGEIAFSQNRASVKGLTAKAGKSSLVLDGTVNRPLALLAKPGSVAPARVDFTLRSPHLDLAELLPTTTGEPILPNAEGGGQVAIGRLQNQKLDVTAVRADVALEPGVLVVPQYSMNGYGGRVRGTARFDLRDPATPKLSVKSQIDSVQADALLSTWTPAKGLVRGSLTSTLDLATAGATPQQVRNTITAIGLALFADGQLGPGPALEAIADLVRLPSLKDARFKNMRMPFRVERGRVYTDPVVVQGSAGEWRLSGAIGFDGSLDYAVSITLPRSLAEAAQGKSAMAAGALADENGNLLIDLRVTGTAKSPRVAWDPGAMRDRLAGRVSQALESQRDKLENEVETAVRAREQAARDSVKRSIERARKAYEDSLKARAGSAIKGFFGAPKEAPKDTGGP